MYNKFFDFLGFNLTFLKYAKQKNFFRKKLSIFKYSI